MTRGRVSAKPSGSVVGCRHSSTRTTWTSASHQPPATGCASRRFLRRCVHNNSHEADPPLSIACCFGCGITPSFSLLGTTLIESIEST
ncbi:hypothetical protein TsFJ059_005327 [Trichoderma semiorbis]|uniref:Uncharacterized protein n=1 Tax=Trichoderma semiorbis TaxID=1491008 RepID=A0A9P8KTF4_9HYPO|nr:hypothetical protein TsFJ059_005327 [Trichoderma semiorbis]